MKYLEALLTSIVAMASPVIAQVTAPAAPTLRITSRKVLVGRDDAALSLDRYVQVAVSDGGVVAISDARGAFVGTIDASGRLKRVGRSGDGPGEFRGGLSVGWLGDTLWAVDRGTRRVTQYRAGKLVSADAFRGMATAGHIIETPTALTSDGAICLAIPNVSGGQRNLPTSVPMLLTTRDGRQRRDSLFAIEHIAGPLTVRKGDRAIMLEQPFDRGTLYAVSANGRYIAYTTRSGASARLGAPSEAVALRSGSGRILYSTPAPFAPVRLLSTLVDSVVRSRLEETNRGARSMKLSETDIRASLFVPSHLPSVDQLVVGNDGRVILRAQAMGAPSTAFLLLDASGRPTGTWTMSAHASILAFDGVRIVVLEQTDDELWELVSSVLGKA